MTIHEYLSLNYKDNNEYSATTLAEFIKAGIQNILFHIKVGGNRLNDVLALCRKHNIERDVVFGVGNLEDVKKCQGI